MALIDISGQKFGRLSAIREGDRLSGRRAWICRCDCGNKVLVMMRNLRRGNSRSCGCEKNERIKNLRRTHGQSRTSEYNIWIKIIGRCYNPNEKQYADWGGRGIRMCNGWRNSSANFLSDMGKRPSRLHSIDRIDNNGHYSCGHCEDCIANGLPANCRWGTSRDQSNNTRRNHNLTFNGLTLSVAEWSRRMGIGGPTIRFRLRLGWSIERALTTTV